MTRAVLLAILSLCVLAILPAKAQTDDYTWDRFVYDYTTDEEQAEEEEWILYLEELKDIHEHPMNINTAGVSDLLRLPFLSEEQIEQIHAYIYLHGSMQTLGELRLLPLIDYATRQKLRLFVYAGEPPAEGTKARQLFSHLRHTFSARTDVPLYYRKGYLVDDGYAGDALYHRIRYDVKNSRHLQAGFRVEKDAGERYYDTYGAYAMLRDVGILHRAVVGDFRAGFGEGVVMGGSLWHSKSTPSMREQSGIRPMTGMDESRFMRGMAATLGLGSEAELSVFASYRRVDATLNADDEIKTLLTDGYHRTASEHRSRHNVGSTQTGAHLAWHHGDLRLGATGYLQRFSQRLNPGEQLYRRIYPRGTTFGVAGINYGYSFYRLTLAGETAVSMPHTAAATMNRASWSINSRYTLSLLGRYYASNYHSFLATSFAENSTVQNESGLLLHLKAQPSAGWLLTAYADFFHNPWPRYRMTHSSSGQDFMAQADYTPGDGAHTIGLRYQLKRKEQADRMEPHHRIRTQWTFLPHRSWRLQTTALLHRLLGKTGSAIQHTVRFTSPADCLRLALTASYFHSPDYSTRLYVFEPALYNSISSAVLYGHGLHGALTGRLTSRNGRWMVEARYSLYRYFDRDTQSSDLQTIYSPWRNDLSFQLRFKF
ncbi:MAG: helix-hairpin-helix domain-containing protein [Bacteroidaceae bacterium]|nr:helix-hairpin-helix domain-containing protein [Bacteroidaceae bacterium]